MVSTRNLSADTRDKLRDLVRVNADSARGFREAAARVEDDRLTRLLIDCAVHRERFAQELQRHLPWRAVQEATRGSLAGEVHRWWIDVKGLLTGGDPHAILVEVERGEDTITRVYEDAVEETEGNLLNGELRRQLAQIGAVHDRMRALRDEFAD